MVAGLGEVGESPQSHSRVTLQPLQLPYIVGGLDTNHYPSLGALLVVNIVLRGSPKPFSSY